jgi:hypothetical protein
MAVDELIAEAAAIKVLGANVLDVTDIGTYAVEYAIRNMAVFPLNGKIPAIAGGRGVLDATTHVPTVIGWWAGNCAGCNIGGRVPESMFVLDIDPRHGGIDSLASLQDRHGRLPETLTTISGRGDGGRHLFYRRPHGRLSGRRLGRGIDIKTCTGYVVLPPSIHPDSGKPYTRIEHPVAAPSSWLVDLLRLDEAPRLAVVRPRRRNLVGPAVADWYCAQTTWAEVLEPHGWRLVEGDGDDDGSRWQHPAATSSTSASVRNGCLFVYSPNTPFEVTESGDRHGQTKFRAYAVLNHNGDMRAAARSLTKDSAPQHD